MTRAIGRVGMVGLVGLPMGVFACGGPAAKSIQTSPGENCDCRELELHANRDVDILFVVDNSCSMGAAQAKLAAAFPALLESIASFDEESAANVRVGVTTTDNGNVDCAGTTPEGGALRLSACTERPDEFSWPDEAPTVEAFDTACAASCPAAVADQLELLPSRTSLDPVASPRPWLEVYEGAPNVRGGNIAEAFGCYGPQGVDGCGFEAPLESMFKAVQRSKTHNQAQYGFVRETAVLAVAVVTDELDCSANEGQQAQVFDRNLPEDQRVFWEDPTAPEPTSAICWNAGVACSGTDGIYDDCVPENWGPTGSQSIPNAADQAVLRPVERYVSLLQQIEDDKRAYNNDQQVVVATIAGVPDGYAEGLAELVYQDADDPAVQGAYGVDYGCTSSDGSGFGLPPVRLRSFSEAFNVAEDPETSRNLHSVCRDDFEAALRGFGNDIASQLQPGCMEKCVQDVDPETPELEVDCTLTQRNDQTNEITNIPPCEGRALPAGETVCFVARTGDRLPRACAEAGWNLAFDIIRDPAATPPGPTTIRFPQCRLSEEPEVDCPDL